MDENVKQETLEFLWYSYFGISIKKQKRSMKMTKKTCDYMCQKSVSRYEQSLEVQK